jgi:hypothetical protein
VADSFLTKYIFAIAAASHIYNNNSNKMQFNVGYDINHLYGTPIFGVWGMFGWTSRAVGARFMFVQLNKEVVCEMIGPVRA